MITGNFTRENTINEFLPFSTFHWRHRKSTFFYNNYNCIDSNKKHRTKLQHTL